MCWVLLGEVARVAVDVTNDVADALVSERVFNESVARLSDDPDLGSCEIEDKGGGDVGRRGVTLGVCVCEGRGGEGVDVDEPICCQQVTDVVPVCKVMLV